MAKKKSESSVRGGRRKRKKEVTMTREIDFSDIPELSDEQLRRARRVGRPKSKDPVKRLIAFRIRPGLLGELVLRAKREGKPYQTLMHELLEKAVKE